MKRYISLCTALLMLIGIICISSTCHANNRTDPFQEYFSSRPLTDFLTEDDTAALASAYPAEFTVLSAQTHTPVSLITEDIHVQLKKLAIQHPSSNFPALLDELFVRAFDNAANAFNEEQAAQTSTGLFRARPDQMEVRNRTVETLVSFRALKATEGEHVGLGTSITKSIEVGYETGDTILGYKIGSASASYTVAYTLNGPSSNDRIGNYYATHAYAFGVLYGSIQKVSYDLYYAASGEFFTHQELTTISSPDALDTTFLFSITGTKTYIRHSSSDKVSAFDNHIKAVNAICEKPASYI